MYWITKHLSINKSVQLLTWITMSELCFPLWVCRICSSDTILNLPWPTSWRTKFFVSANKEPKQASLILEVPGAVLINFLVIKPTRKSLLFTKSVTTLSSAVFVNSGNVEISGFTGLCVYDALVTLITSIIAVLPELGMIFVIFWLLKTKSWPRF